MATTKTETIVNNTGDTLQIDYVSSSDDWNYLLLRDENKIDKETFIRNKGFIDNEKKIIKYLEISDKESIKIRALENSKYNFVAFIETIKNNEITTGILDGVQSEIDSIISTFNTEEKVFTEVPLDMVTFINVTNLTKTNQTAPDVGNQSLTQGLNNTITF